MSERFRLTVRATYAFFFCACFNLQSLGFDSNSLADAKATIAFKYGCNVFAACFSALSNGVDALAIGLCLPLGTWTSRPPLPLLVGIPRREDGEAVRERGVMARRKFEVEDERGERSRTGELDPPKMLGVRVR